jgi:hypothetical protein
VGWSTFIKTVSPSSTLGLKKAHQLLLTIPKLMSLHLPHPVSFLPFPCHRPSSHSDLVTWSPAVPKFRESHGASGLFLILAANPAVDAPSPSMVRSPIPSTPASSTVLPFDFSFVDGLWRMMFLSMTVIDLFLAVCQMFEGFPAIF